MNGTGIGEVRTKLLDTDHKQWNCGMGVFDPDVVFYKEDSDGYVIIDGKRCKLIEEPDRSNPNLAILKGQVLDNTFYKNINDDIICSKLVDSISLPDGYNKCYYVYNSNLVSGTAPLISTGVVLPKKYGHIYWSCKQKSAISSYASTWRTGYLGESYNVTRAIMNGLYNQLIYSDMRAGSGGTSITGVEGIFGYEITDKQTYKVLINDTYHNMSNTSPGLENTDDTLYFLSQCADINLYYMFVIDDNKNVTHCFIPCQKATTGQFGLYEVVSNQFFGNDALTGVLLSNVKFIYEKIGDKIYKTVKIGNLQWMAENLDYKWDGLRIGTENFTEDYWDDPAAAAYRDDDESTWGWNNRKCGLYYNHEAIEAMEKWDGHPGVLPDGWRVPSYDEYAELMEYIKDENDVYRIDKLFVPDCSWSPYSKPADAKMNEFGLSLIPAGYYTTAGEWNDLSTSHIATIGTYDATRYDDFFRFSAPTSSTYGSDCNGITYGEPSTIRLVKDV